jgi:alcohol dehydrogenase class IV
MINNFEFRVPRIIFGIDKILTVSEIATEFEAKKVLIVTDSIIRKIGLVDKICESLKSKGLFLHVFDEVRPEPDVNDVEKLVSEIRKNNYDLLVGVGGGSVMDATKIASVLSPTSKSLLDLVDLSKGAIQYLTVSSNPVKKILIPTTAGTGSEVSMSCVINIGRLRVSVRTPLALADVVIIDPLMSISMPPQLTASTGLDALSHAIESFMSINSTPITEALSLQAAKMIIKYLLIAYENGRDLKARSYMALASTIAGIAMANAGAVLGHSLAYGYASRFKLSHGVSVGMALPYVIMYNSIVIPEKLNLFSKELGFLDVKEFVSEIYKLLKKLNLPTTLKEIGASKSDLEEIAEEVYSSYLRPTNPRKTSKDDILAILMKMYNGECTP